MKKSEIQVGQTYRATVSGKTTIVRVDAIRTVDGYRRPGYGQKKTPDRTAFECTNLTTGRAVVFKSAMKFQRIVNQTQEKTNVPQEHSQSEDSQGQQLLEQDQKGQQDSGTPSLSPSRQAATSRAKIVEGENCSDPSKRSLIDIPSAQEFQSTDDTQFSLPQLKSSGMGLSLSLIHI